jgi:hypothetical protein
MSHPLILQNCDESHLDNHVLSILFNFCGEFDMDCSRGCTARLHH